MVNRNLFFLAAVLLGFEPAFATTIVVLKTQSEIVAGADSMSRPVVLGGKSLPPFYNLCKIFPVHDFFIGVAGFHQTGTGKWGRLNIEQLVRSGVQKSDNLELVVKRSLERITKAFRQLVLDTKEDDEFYEELLRRNVITFFFGFENGKPAVYAQRYRIDKSKDQVRGEQYNCGPDCLPADGMHKIFGTPSRTLTDFFAQQHSSSKEPIEMVKNLISLDIEANKDRSGPPVDILRIDAKGAEWIEQKPECR